MPSLGWYRDPERTAPVRWWDGERWTAWQADSARAPYPPPGPVETVAARRSPWSRRLLLGGGVALAGLAGATAYGMRLDAANRDQALASIRPSTLGSLGPGPQEDMPIVLDPATGTVRWSRLFSAVLPTAPFVLESFGSSTFFESYAAAILVTDPGWTTKDTWWPSAAVVAIPKKELVDPTDLAASAGSIAAVTRSRLWDLAGDQGEITVEQVSLPDGRKAPRATAPVRFLDQGEAVGLRLRLTLIQAHPLAHLVWLDFLQDRAVLSTAEALDRAYATIWVA